MAAREQAVAVKQIGVVRRSGTVVVVGNPNSGKSTLFNRLTGLRQRTANYPGVTVEKHFGTTEVNGRTLELVDLPGTYALSAHSTEERIAVEVILGRIPGTAPPAGVLAVVDATRLYQGLYLIQQLLEMQIPTVLALTMVDVAQRSGVSIDVERLQTLLGGTPICPVVATTGQGLDALRQALAELPSASRPQPDPVWPELAEVAESFAAKTGGRLRTAEVMRAMIDRDTDLVTDLTDGLDLDLVHQLKGAAGQVFGDQPPLATEARRRYAWIREVVAAVETRAPLAVRMGARLVAWLNRPVPATIGFFLLMGIVFQAVFSWANPIMDVIDGATAALSGWVNGRLPEGPMASLIVDGAIAGVGSVVIFLPQILILFLFIILLEDSGYLARAAFLMDRAMRAVGLSGQSVIPMLSSFACAVPAIMATRVIPNRRDRIATIVAAPFMTCSARLPVYALLIAAFVPGTSVGWLNLQGLVLFGLYMLGIVGGLATALLLRSSVLRGPKPTFMLSMPEFRMPNWRTVALQLLARAKIFLKRAGTVIFAVAVVVWSLAYFPRTDQGSQIAEQRSAAELRFTGDALQAEYQRIEDEASAAQLANSWLGRAGRFVEPIFTPLGWDWKVSSAVIAGFPAREVVVAVLGTIYAVGEEADEARLSERLQAAVRPNGQRVFTLPMVIGLLIFYAWCLQCAATVAVIRRETNSWTWAGMSWLYMTSVAYCGALLAYQLGSKVL